jgi:hypothetical protein
MKLDDCLVIFPNGARNFILQALFDGSPEGIAFHLHPL